MRSLIVDKIWYGTHPLRWVLIPFSWSFDLICSLRRWYLQEFAQVKTTVPVIVVGNLSVGGVGKTPLVIELVNKLKERGINVGVVSRGYGAQQKSYPYEIQKQDLASQVGDEPLLIAQKTNCPVVISPKRDQAVTYLIENKKCQIIVSDDGLQHYRMGRAVEIVVIDGQRGLGNGWSMPAGPLREKEKRLKQVDFIIVNDGTWVNAHQMSLEPGIIRQLMTQETIDPQLFTHKAAAVAAIGNPQRFYSTLKKLGINFNAYSYPDHYQFKADDLNYTESWIIMTEKDAVKCHSLQSPKMYYVPVKAVLNDEFWDALWSHQQLKGFLDDV